MRTVPVLLLLCRACFLVLNFRLLTAARGVVLVAEMRRCPRRSSALAAARHPLPLELHALVEPLDTLTLADAAMDAAAATAAASRVADAPTCAAARWLIADLVARLLAVLLLPDTPAAAEAAEGQPSELFKLQRGCIDALSFMLEVPAAEAAEETVPDRRKAACLSTSAGGDAPFESCT